MNGVETLEAFDQELVYLLTHVYANSIGDVDRFDPIREDPVRLTQTSQWQKISDILTKTDTHTSVHEGLNRAYLDRFLKRPSTMAEGNLMLLNMRLAIKGLIDCLKLGIEETAQNPGAKWILPMMRDMQLSYYKNFWNGRPIEGKGIAVEREFHASIGRQAFGIQDMHVFHNRTDTFGRIALDHVTHDALGHYICEMDDGTLRVVDWAFLPKGYDGKKGLPDELALDLMEFLGPRSPFGKRYDIIECVTDRFHPPLPKPKTWRQQPGQL